MGTVTKLPVKYRRQLITETAGILARASQPPKLSKTFRKYEALLKGQRAMTKGEIAGLQWALDGRRAAKLTTDDRRVLQDLLDARAERPISKEHAAIGIAWLKRVAFRLDGTPRQTKKQPFCDRELTIIRTFSRFAWIGYHNTQEDFGNWNGCSSRTPVWRCFSKHGGYFDYYVISSGPGGSVDIVIV